MKQRTWSPFFRRQSPFDRGQKLAQASLQAYGDAQLDAPPWVWEGSNCATGIYFSEEKRQRFLNGWLAAGRQRWPDLPANTLEIFLSERLSHQYGSVFPQEHMIALAYRIAGPREQSQKTYYQIEYAPERVEVYALLPGSGAPWQFVAYASNPPSEEQIIAAVKLAHPGAERLVSEGMQEELQARWLLEKCNLLIPSPNECRPRHQR